MTKRRSGREAKRLKEAAQEYRRKGYDVMVEPRGDQMPGFLQSFSPDMIIRKGDENIVVEVKTRESLSASEQLDRIAEVIAEQPSWELRLILTNPRATSVADIENSLSPGEILDLLKHVDRLSDLEEIDASLLLVTAAIEAAIRLIARKESIKIEGKNILGDAKRLVSYGVLLESEYDSIETIAQSRSALAHGYRHRPVDVSDIKEMADCISEIVKNSQIERVA